MFSADFIEYFFIDRLPIYGLAFCFAFFDYRLDHGALDILILCYARLPFAEPAKILINSHYKPPMLMLCYFIHTSAVSMGLIITHGTQNCYGATSDYRPRNSN